MRYGLKTLLITAVISLTLPGIAQAQTVLSAESQMTQTSQAEQRNAQSNAQSTDAAWNALLGTYVGAPDAGGVARFDYAGLSNNAADRAVLRAYIDDLAAQSPSTMDAPNATAYWANLYNALTIDVVVDNYPVSSIKKIKSGAFSAGPWKRKLVTVEGEKLTLDNIEHDILRVKYLSPLIHYMVNCASIGCPNLKNSLWTASSLDADRDAAARAFINSPRGVMIDGDDLTVSSIYKWFKEDFGDSNAGVLDHLAQYANAELKAAIDAGARIDDHDYDWSLNE